MMRKLVLIVILLLASCSRSPITPGIDNTKPLNYTTKFVRTYPYDIDAQYPKYYLFNTYDSFSKYLENDALTFGGYEDNQEISNLIKKYDEDYFNSHSLVILLLLEPSGSIRHQIESVKIVENVLHVNLVKRVPEIGDSAMAVWSIFIELDKNNEKVKELEVSSETTELK